MPLKRCSSDGKSGWRWGDEGKCFVGPDGKKKAIRQGIAIEGPEKFQQMSSAEKVNFSKKEICTIADFMYELGYGLKSIVAITATLSSEGKKHGSPEHECPAGKKCDEKLGKCVKIDDTQAEAGTERPDVEIEE